MNVIHSPTELSPPRRKVCLAIGFFDGVHLGHQQIIRQTITDARQHEAVSVVITFDRHPNTVVAPGHVPPLIYSLPQRLRTIESLGADTLFLIRFDKIFSQQTGEQFIRDLAQNLGEIQSICVGANFAFGHKRSGNVELLKKLGDALDFTVHGLSAVSLDDKPVSSTRIREAVLRGDLDTASQMLGRAYALAGTVLQGDRLGHKIGFPTANLDPTGLALPPDGVYAIQAQTFPPSSPRSDPLFMAPKSDKVGTINRQPSPLYRSVLNIGCRPTIQSATPQRRVEAHLLDFQGDLYGQELELTFLEKLRDEQKFASLDDLRAQISRDIENAKTLF
jgi:riboflavin kinase/FMN adenylyltransferase